MDILGIGPLEIVLILLLALIVLGPKDLQKTGKTIGQSLNKLVRSDTWKTISQTSRELRQLPTKLMREASIDEFKETVKEIKTDIDTTVGNKDLFADWSAPPAPIRPVGKQEPAQEHSVAPQDGEPKKPE